MKSLHLHHSDIKNDRCKQLCKLLQCNPSLWTRVQHTVPGSTGTYFMYERATEETTTDDLYVAFSENDDFVTYSLGQNDAMDVASFLGNLAKERAAEHHGWKLTTIAEDNIWSVVEAISES